MSDFPHYTRYNTVHTNTEASRLLAALPDDGELVVHHSVKGEGDRLLQLLARMRAERPESYFGEIYSQVLEPGPMRANYISAALNTAHTPVDNKTRYALQLTLIRYVIVHGRDFKRFSVGEFSYALHEHAFREAGNNATIGLLPWAFLESWDVTSTNVSGLPFGDFLIYTAIEELNPPDGKISAVGLLVRQYIDYTSQLWRPVIRDGWDFFK